MGKKFPRSGREDTEKPVRGPAPTCARLQRPLCEVHYINQLPERRRRPVMHGSAKERIRMLLRYLTSTERAIEEWLDKALASAKQAERSGNRPSGQHEGRGRRPTE